MGSLLSNVFGNLLADAIIAALVGGGVIAWMKSRGAQWSLPILWGLTGAVLILLGAGAMRLIAFPFPEPAPQISTDNVEAKLKDWLERFGYSVKKLPATHDKYFQYEATNQHGRAVTLSRSKNAPFDFYVAFDNQVTLGTEDERLFKALPDVSKSKFKLYLVAEMARSRLIFSINYSPEFHVQLEKTLPIAPGLTEATFMQTMTDMDDGQLLLLNVIPLELLDLSKSR